MRSLHILTGIFILFASCKNDKNSMQEIQRETPKKLEFFPVTDYIRGQVFEIKNGGVNPLKIIISNNRSDSSWLKMEMLEVELKEFLSPKIDSTNLLTLFSENKFMDQTLDAVTLSYDPVKVLPDSIDLKHWDIYIDPKNGYIRRIYLVKNLPGGKTEQLTWTSGKSCNILVIKNSSNGKYSIEKNTTIQWSF